MSKNTRRVAIGGMMAALATAMLLMGGVIPAATFCGPALAGMLLVPVLVEGGRRYALGAWLAISALSLMLCADKEAALVFAFLGYYPAIKGRLDARFRPVPRVLVKLALWNLSAAALVALIFFVLRMDQVIAEYREMGLGLLAAFIVLGNVTMLIYDRLLNVVAALYLHKLRPKLFKG